MSGNVELVMAVAVVPGGRHIISYCVLVKAMAWITSKCPDPLVALGWVGFGGGLDYYSRRFR